MSTGRNTALRDKHRAQIRRGKPDCHICGEEIDYTLPYLHPYEFVVDHVIPIDRGGRDTLDNKAAAHRSCNRTKGNKLPGLQPLPGGAIFITSRTW